jgi:hypothetical protein
MRATPSSTIGTCGGCGIVIGTAKGANAHENEHGSPSGRRVDED